MFNLTSFVVLSAALFRLSFSLEDFGKAVFLSRLAVQQFASKPNMKQLLQVAQPYVDNYIHKIKSESHVSLADFGSGKDGHALDMFNYLTPLMRKNEVSKHVHAYAVDKYTNSFSILMSIYGRSFSHLVYDQSFLLSNVVGEFFSPQELIYENTLDIATSVDTLHWMSVPFPFNYLGKRREVLPVDARNTEDEATQQMLKHTEQDMTNFLLARVKELKDNGLLVFQCNALKEPELADSQRTMRVYDVLREARQKWEVSDGNDCLILPALPRTIDDVKRALNSQNLSKQYKVELLTVLPYESEIFKAFKSGKVGYEEYFKQRFDNYRAAFYPLMEYWLHDNPEAIKWVFDNMEKHYRSLGDQWNYQHDNLIAVLSRVPRENSK